MCKGSKYFIWRKNEDIPPKILCSRFTFIAITEKSYQIIRDIHFNCVSKKEDVICMGIAKINSNTSYSDIVKEISKKNDLDLVDLVTPIVEFNYKVGQEIVTIDNIQIRFYEINTKHENNIMVCCPSMKFLD